MSLMRRKLLLFLERLRAWIAGEEPRWPSCPSCGSYRMIPRGNGGDDRMCVRCRKVVPAGMEFLFERSWARNEAGYRRLAEDDGPKG